MSFERFTSIVDRMPRLAEVGLQGLGEPLLNPGFWQMCQYLKRKNLRVSFNTNGSLLTGDAGARIFDLNIDEVRLSYDSVIKEHFEYIRNGLDFDRVTQNIIRFCSEKQKRGGSFPKIVITIVGMRENSSDIPGIVDFALEHGVDKIELLNLYVLGRGLAVDENSFIRMERGEVLDLMDCIWGKCREAGVEFLAPILDREEVRKRVLACGWPWEGIYITWDGYVTPCCVISDPTRFSVGNVFEMGLDSLWNSHRYQQFRGEFSNGCIPGVCISCFESQHILENFLEVTTGP
jgi:radical SAM protein with 4Fe4S-binding SPASM domain